MATTSLAGGRLRVTHPDDYRATTTPTRDVELGAPVDVDSLIVNTLRQNGFDTVHRVVVGPRARNRTPDGRRGETRVALALDVGTDEDAVLLLQNAGCYTWLRPRHETSRSAGPVGRTAVFDVVIPATDAADREVEGLRLDQVRATVLSFGAPVLAGAAIAVLEAFVRPGLVHVTTPDVSGWNRIDTLTDAGLSPDRTNRVLLLVHGTFDSTLGAFGALAVTDSGRELLSGALADYDAVLGFDHRTLSVDPLQNARDLADLLTAFPAREPVTIDVVCHSRGGLTARSFIEEVLPGLAWRGEVDRVVFVAATNAGTHFADPARWADLADLYVNLVAAHARALSQLPGGAAVAAVAVAAVRGVGALVRWLAAYATDAGNVPGLAAMVPDGPFVTALNAYQQGQPRSGTPWFVVSSDFEVTVEGHPPELPAAVVARLVDGVVDQVIPGPNDLVVDVESMSAIDLPVGGGYVRDRLALGPDATVYHTTYFRQPVVGQALVGWLLRRLDRLEEPAPAVPSPDTDEGGPRPSGQRGPSVPGPLSVPGGRGPTPAPPAPEPEPPEPEPPAAEPEAPGPDGTEARLRATFAAELPRNPVAGAATGLRVRLSRSALVATNGTTSARTVFEVRPERPVDVQVVPSCNVALDGPDLDRVQLPPGGGWSELQFTLRPVAPGPLRVKVLARQGRDVLGSVQLDAVAVHPDEGSGDALALTRSQVEVASATSPVLDDVAWLEIAQVEAAGETRFRYELRLPGVEERITGTSPPLRDTDGFVTALFREVSQLWFDSSDRPAKYLADLQDLGSSLFEQLFPQDLQAVLWKHRDALDNLFLLADEPYIPWELVHLKPPTGPRQKAPRFLGQLGLVRWPFTAFPSDVTLPVRHGRVFSVCPDYADDGLDLGEVQAEAAFLASTLGATAVGATEEKVRRLLRRRGGFDLLHFSGHGLAEPGNIAEAKIALAGRTVGGAVVADYLTSTTVAENARLRRRAGPGPLVVLNACQVGRGGEELSSLGGFARAFLDAGAAAFVSCLWSVNQTPARIFVEAFYTRLLAGDTVAQAAVAARSAARGQGDATWLAYVVYARPDAVLVRG